jgi:hypothetical protein
VLESSKFLSTRIHRSASVVDQLGPAVGGCHFTGNSIPLLALQAMDPIQGGGAHVRVSLFPVHHRPKLNASLARNRGRRSLREHDRMATTEELLAAIDERLLEGIRGKTTPEGVAKLAEARAWISNPDQPHGSTLST